MREDPPPSRILRRVQPLHLETVFHELSALHDGVMGVRELERAGVSRTAVRRRVSAGLLQPVFVGVVRQSFVDLTPARRAVAAALVVGEGCHVSHRSAAVLHGVPPKKLWTPYGEHPPEVSIDGFLRVRRDGIMVHRSGPWPLPQRSTLQELFGVKVSNPTRTIIELATVVASGPLELILDQFLMEKRTTVARLIHTLNDIGTQGRAGSKQLMQLLIERRDGMGLIMSWLEQQFIREIRQRGLPEPVRNYQIRTGGRRRVLDIAWPDSRTAVEAMGARWHGAYGAQKADVARERALLVDGWRVLPATMADVRDPT
jgi:hypothetical protein